MKIKDLLKNSKGFTFLEAIVVVTTVTTISLFSISAIQNEEGILTQAEEANEELERFETEEKIKLALMDSYGEMGKVDFEKAKNELSVQGIFSGEMPGDIVFNGYKFKVDEEGKVIALQENKSLERAEVIEAVNLELNNIYVDILIGNKIESQSDLDKANENLDNYSNSNPVLQYDEENNMITVGNLKEEYVIDIDGVGIKNINNGDAEMVPLR